MNNMVRCTGCGLLFTQRLGKHGFCCGHCSDGNGHGKNCTVTLPCESCNGELQGPRSCGQLPFKKPRCKRGHNGHHDEFIEGVVAKPEFKDWLANVKGNFMKEHEVHNPDDTFHIGLFCKAGNNRSVGCSLILATIWDLEPCLSYMAARFHFHVRFCEFDTNKRTLLCTSRMSQALQQNVLISRSIV